MGEAHPRRARRLIATVDDVNVRLRSAVPGDAEAASVVALSAKAHWGYPAHWLERWRPELTITPEYIAHHRVVVAVAADVIIGFHALEQRGARWSLAHLWVAPEWHGRGIGRLLLGDALAAIRRIRPGVLEVESDPHAAPFYERCGARRIGSVPAGMPEDPSRTLPLLEFAAPA